MLRTFWMTLIAATFGVAGAASAASFGEVDANGDGAISQDEFVAANPQVGADVWEQIDVNGDGQVTEDEHQAAVEAGRLPAE